MLCGVSSTRRRSTTPSMSHCSSSSRSAWSASCHGLFRQGRAPGRDRRRLRLTAWKKCSSAQTPIASVRARRTRRLTSMPAGQARQDCSPLATLTVGRRLDAAPRVNVLLDEVASAFEIKSDLLSIHADLLAGRPTYPIAFVARAAGLSLDPWPDANGGAWCAGGDKLRGFDDRRRDLPTSRGPPARRRSRFGHVRRIPSRCRSWARGAPSTPRAHRVTNARAGSGTSAPPPLIVLAQPTLPKALEMAEGFLVADPTFRESWESHREGMFGSPEVASHFPAGLILEILSAPGTRGVHAHRRLPRVHGGQPIPLLRSPFVPH